mgnify:CR=1 FL=1
MSVWVEQEFCFVKAHSIFRNPWTVNPVSISLAWSNSGKVAVPNWSIAVRHGITGFYKLSIDLAEKAELNGIGGVNTLLRKNFTKLPQFLGRAPVAPDPARGTADDLLRMQAAISGDLDPSQDTPTGMGADCVWCQLAAQPLVPVDLPHALGPVHLPTCTGTPATGIIAAVPRSFARRRAGSASCAKT